MKLFRTALVTLAFTLAASAQETKQHAFFDKTNLALFSADALVRSLDAESTRANLTNPCKCFFEENTPAISARTSTQYAYSLGYAAGMMGLSYLAHRRGYHKIERLFPMIDIVVDGRAVIHNYSLSAPPPAPVSHLPNRHLP